MTDEIIVKIPKEFFDKKIEIIILPLEENSMLYNNKRQRLLKVFNESSGRLQEGYKFNREEAHEG